MAEGRKAVLRSFGETPLAAIEPAHLEIRPQARPEPGPDEVIVGVRAATINWVDLLMMAGLYQHLLQPPWTPGLEYSGVVEAVGASVSGWQPGDRVYADGLYTGPRSQGRWQREGGLQSWARAPATALCALPVGWGFAEGANLLGNYETAWHCLVARGRIQSGETVLILGASGATGLAAVDIARRTGCTVIAAGRSEEKLAVVAQRGAHHVLNTAGEALRTLGQRVKALTGGRGADVVYDGVGGVVSQAALRAVRFGARYLVVGWASTPFVADSKGRRGAPRANQLPTNLILMKGLDVLGCPVAIHTHRDPSIRAPRLAALERWIGQGLRPHAPPIRPMSALREALRERWAGRHAGGLVVAPQEEA